MGMVGGGRKTIKPVVKKCKCKVKYECLKNKGTTRKDNSKKKQITNKK
jgi:hypothetical protein